MSRSRQPEGFPPAYYIVTEKVYTCYQKKTIRYEIREALMGQVTFASFILVARILVARTCFGKLILWIRGGQNLA